MAESAVADNKHSRHMIIIITVSIVALLCCGIIGGVAYKRHQSSLAKQRAASEQANKDQQAYTKALKQIETFKNQRRYDDAIAAARYYINNGDNAENIAAMYAQIGVIYEQKGDCTAAITAYKQAESQAPQEILAVDAGIGHCSYVLKDNKTALIYFKKAVSWMEGTKQQRFAMDIDTYQRTIKTLEAQQ